MVKLKRVTEIDLETAKSIKGGSGSDCYCSCTCGEYQMEGNRDWQMASVAASTK